MKKKISLIALLAVASSVLAFAVGCGGGSHQHSYKTKSDSQFHWQECECGDKKMSFSHADAKNNDTGEDGADGKCDVCGASVPLPHDHAYTEIAFDTEEHWYECECGEQDPARVPAAHMDIENNETYEPGADGKCDVCGAAVHGHEYTLLKTDLTQHWYECACGEKDGITDHVDVLDNETGAETPDDKCDVCNASVHHHAYTVIGFDADGHWYECECGEKDPASATVAHADAKNNDTGEDGADDKCDVCGAAVHLVHKYTQLKIGMAQHWYECACGEKDGITDHVDVLDNETEVTGADNKCDVCGAVMHEHAYDELKSDSDGHWNECACGAKGNVGAHVDEVDNETKEAGQDGKCDVCEYQFIYTVTFEIGEFGEAPEAQEVPHGGYAVEPPTPAAPQGVVFEGWFVDDGFVTSFDFANTAITADKTVYAKWVVVPGSTKENAVTIGKDDETLVAQFGALDRLYFKYTAAAQSRMTISIVSRNALKNCTFTTGLDNDQTVYGYGDELYFDLEKGETIYVTVLRGDGVADTQKVGLYLTDVTSEPFPEEGWVTGTYVCGNITLEFNKENKTANYNGSGTSSVTYIGGKYPHANVTITLVGQDVFCTLTQPEEDQILLTGKASLVGNLNYLFVREIPQEPIPLSKFSGVYRTKDGVDEITEVCIYENGNGYYIQSNHQYNQTLGSANSSFDQKKNILTYAGSYKITVNLTEEGDPVSINLNGVTYSRVSDSGDEPPAKLPLPNSIELVGETFSIICQSGQQQWGNSTTVQITGYVKATEIYTVKYGSFYYTLEIEGSGDDVTVKIFNKEHTTLLDTLTKKTVELKALKLDGTDNEVAAQDVVSNFAIFAVPASGVYVFNVKSIAPKMYSIYVYNDYEGDNCVYIDKLESKTKLILQAGKQFAINFAEYGTSFKGMVFTLQEVVADPGTTPDSPFELSVGKEFECEALSSDTDNDYYATFTATEAGEYHIGCYAMLWGDKNYKVSFTVNGVTNGFVPVGYYYGYYYRDGIELGDMYDAAATFAEAPYATVHLEAGETVSIVLNRKNQAGVVDKVAITLEKAD